VAKATIAVLSRDSRFVVEWPKIDPNRAMPYALNPFRFCLRQDR